MAGEEKRDVEEKRDRGKEGQTDRQTDKSFCRPTPLVWQKRVEKCYRIFLVKVLVEDQSCSGILDQLERLYMLEGQRGENYSSRVLI